MIESVKQSRSGDWENKRNVFVRDRLAVKDRLLSYLHIHAQTLVSSLGRLPRSPYSSMMTIMVIAVALTLPGGFYVLVENFKQLSGVLETRNHISLFLKHTVTNETGKGIAKQVTGKPWVKQAKVITKEEGLKEFRDYSGFNSGMAFLEFNPLPVVIQIEPVETINEFRKLHGLIAELERIPNVESAQIDLQWVERVYSIMNLVRRGVVLLGLLLGMAVIFIVSNTLRLELKNRSDEIIVAKLVGATNGFIRRPFLYSGFWYGILSSLLGLIFIQLIIKVLEGPINEIAFLYGSEFKIQGLSVNESLTIVAISIILAITGAWLVLGSHLRHLKAE